MSKRQILYTAAGLTIALALIYAFLPDPVPVETEEVSSGPMSVTIDEQGKTRVIDRFAITAPAAGRVQRIELREGAPVTEGMAVAVIEPAPLDPARRQELQALLSAAQAAQSEALASVSRAQSAWELTRAELRRVEGLAAGGVVSQSAIDAARTADETARRELAAARAGSQAAASNVTAARARLLSTGAPAASSLITVRSPAAGRVLRVPDRSERVVQPGEPLLEIGNASHLELVIETLSQDAVKVAPGNQVIVHEWGGPEPLHGTVRLVEPSAFTKISALGIEEQRVNVIADVPNAPPNLGDAYRIEASIVIWSDPAALRVPISALGRIGDEWRVYVAENGRARARAVRIGQRTQQHAQVLDGLREGEQVIVHPGTAVEDGARIR